MVIYFHSKPAADQETSSSEKQYKRPLVHELVQPLLDLCTETLVSPVVPLWKNMREGYSESISLSVDTNISKNAVLYAATKWMIKEMGNTKTYNYWLRRN